MIQPKNSDTIVSKTDSSPKFKKQVLLAIASILLFVLVYVSIFASLLFLIAYLLQYGLFVVFAAPHFITVMLYIGLVVAGVFLIIFLLKFLFKRSKVDLSGFKEIKRQDEPALFAMIDEIASEVGTRKPKKVFLSSHVNASVFYDSSFWSMFMPIEKNLEIGLGLINTVTKSELKGILAHEFGHFSQKSMKVGSYVYHVNKVIFGMLNDDARLDRAIGQWASESVFFMLPILGAMKIIGGIQWVLVQLYNIVNKNYMSLSREMEFHADEIAAQISGRAPITSSLLRSSLADESYQITWQFFAHAFTNNENTNNLFLHQRTCFQLLAQKNDVELVQGFPVVKLEHLLKFNNSKLVIDNQWASHPSVEERVERLESLDLKDVEMNMEPANSILLNVERYQEDFTRDFYANGESSSPLSRLTDDEFRSRLIHNWELNSFPEIFQGYFDKRNIESIDLQVDSDIKVSHLNECINEEMLQIVDDADVLRKDIEMLNYIHLNPKTTKTFDYDGFKFRSKNAQLLMKKLQKEYDILNDKLLENEKKMFHYFLSIAPSQKDVDEMRVLYKKCVESNARVDLGLTFLNKMYGALQFVSQEMTIEAIQGNLKNLRELEKEFKGYIRELLQEHLFEEFMEMQLMDKYDLEILADYSAKDLEYFGVTRYYEENLQLLYSALQSYNFVVSRFPQLLKMKLLNLQAKWVVNQVND